MSEGSEREKGRERVNRSFPLVPSGLFRDTGGFILFLKPSRGVKRANRALGPGLALLLLSSCP